MTTVRPATRNMPWSKAGVSTAEFLFWAPLTILLAWLAYDFNRRIEESQLVAIATRNATTMGHTSATAENVDALVSSAAQASIFPLSAADRAAMDTNGAGAGMSISAESGVTIENASLGHPDSIRESDRQGGTSSYNGVARATGAAAKTMAGLMHQVSDLGESLKILPADPVRRGQVSLKIASEGNVMDKGIDLMLSISMGRSPGEVTVAGRSYINRYTVRGEHGYHNSTYRYSGYYGMGFGLLKTEWGTESGDSGRPDSEYLQFRCMNRFFTRNDCNTNTNFLTEPGINFSDAFPKEVRNLATARWTLSLILKALSVFTGGTSWEADLGINMAAEIAVNEAMETIVKEVTSSALDELKDAALQQIPAVDISQLDTFRNQLRSITDAAASGISIDDSKGAVGGTP